MFIAYEKVPLTFTDLMEIEIPVLHIVKTCYQNRIESQRFDLFILNCTSITWKQNFSVVWKELQFN